MDGTAGFFSGFFRGKSRIIPQDRGEAKEGKSGAGRGIFQKDAKKGTAKAQRRTTGAVGKRTGKGKNVFFKATEKKREQIKSIKHLLIGLIE